MENKMVSYIRIAILFVLSASFYASSFYVGTARAAVQEIVAVVNEDIISARDLNKRMRLVMVSSGLPNNKDIVARLIPQVVSSLINEKIMLQEAGKMKIKVSKPEIEAGFIKIAAQNNLKPEEFKDALQKSGVDLTTMLNQIEAQIAWSKVVQRRLRPKVIISERDVDDALERMRSKIGTKEYLTAEIFLPVDNAKNDKQVKQLANRLVKEVKSGKASFFKLAQQFSKSAGSMKGGDKGWLREDQVSSEILDGLRSLRKNQISNPIRTLSGYHILFLRDVRVLDEDSIPSREQIYYNLGAERLEKLQSRYLMDLKAAAFIDVRT